MPLKQSKLVMKCKAFFLFVNVTAVAENNELLKNVLVCVCVFWSTV